MGSHTIFGFFGHKSFLGLAGIFFIVIVGFLVFSGFTLLVKRLRRGGRRKVELLRCQNRFDVGPFLVPL